MPIVERLGLRTIDDRVLALKPEEDFTAIS